MVSRFLPLCRIKSSAYVSVSDRKAPHSDVKAEVIKDNTPDAWAAEAVNNAVKNGILFGDDTGNYKLHSECTRQEMLIFLYRFYKSIKG